MNCSRLLLLLAVLQFLLSPAAQQGLRCDFARPFLQRRPNNLGDKLELVAVCSPSQVELSWSSAPENFEIREYELIARCANSTVTEGERVFHTSFSRIFSTPVAVPGDGEVCTYSGCVIQSAFDTTYHYFSATSCSGSQPQSSSEIIYPSATMVTALAISTLPPPSLTSAVTPSQLTTPTPTQLPSSDIMSAASTLTSSLTPPTPTPPTSTPTAFSAKSSVPQPTQPLGLEFTSSSDFPSTQLPNSKTNVTLLVLLVAIVLFTFTCVVALLLTLTSRYYIARQKSRNYILKKKLGYSLTTSGTSLNIDDSGFEHMCSPVSSMSIPHSASNQSVHTILEHLEYANVTPSDKKLAETHQFFFPEVTQGLDERRHEDGEYINNYNLSLFNCENTADQLNHKRIVFAVSNNDSDETNHTSQNKDSCGTNQSVDQSFSFLHPHHHRQRSGGGGGGDSGFCSIKEKANSSQNLAT